MHNQAKYLWSWIEQLMDDKQKAQLNFYSFTKLNAKQLNVLKRLAKINEFFDQNFI